MSRFPFFIGIAPSTNGDLTIMSTITLGMRVVKRTSPLITSPKIVKEVSLYRRSRCCGQHGQHYIVARIFLRAAAARRMNSTCIKLLSTKHFLLTLLLCHTVQHAD
jgi:hypothetical protein